MGCPLLTVGNVERVNCFRFLGVMLDGNLKWNLHVDAICSKAESRLFFLKVLKRSSVSIDDLFHFYTVAIRPIVEYACPAWHTSLTAEQCNRIECVQKRALNIIFGCHDIAVISQFKSVSSLESRRDDICRKFFNDILKESSCLHYLLPKPRDGAAINRLSLDLGISTVLLCLAQLDLNKKLSTR